MGWLNLWGHDRTRRAIERQSSVDANAVMANDRHLASQIDAVRAEVRALERRVDELERR